MGNTNDVASFVDARNKMKTIEHPKYQYIEYPLKEWVSFSDMGDGRCRLSYKLPAGVGRNMNLKMWKDLDKFEQDRIINKLFDIIEQQYCLKNNK